MTQNISLDSDTDKLEVVSHILNKHWHEAGGDLLYQQARSQTLQTLEKHGVTDFDASDFDDIVKGNNNFTIDDGQYGQEHITGVNTVGSRPTWLETPDENSGDNEALNIGASNTANDEPARQDDFTELSVLTEHQPDALHEAGFDTYNDLYHATVDQLTDVAGVNASKAKKIKEEASEHVDPIKDIAREAARAESPDTESDDKWDVEPGDNDAHLVTDVTIPSGKPRDEDTYKHTNEPWQQFGLPVLELPTLDTSVLRDFAEQVESFDDLLRELYRYTAYTEQFSHFEAELTNEFDTIEEVRDALAIPVDDSLNGVFTQIATDTGTIDAALADVESVNTDTLTPLETANRIDLRLEDEVPVKARLNLVDAFEQKLEETEGDVAELRDDTTLEEFVEASEAPIELDHPFIEDIETFPPLKTRQIDTGEQDIKAAARVMAKNNYALDLVGHAGVGKDTLIRVLAALTNRPSIVINMDESMISQDLMGIHKINDEGQVTFKDGMIPHAAKYGFLLIISEINAAAPEILTAFHQLLERNSKLHVKERDEVIEPSPKFRIATTRNPPTQEYDGAKELNGAFKRRLNSLKLEYLDPQDETDLIDSIVNENRIVISRDEIRTLVEMANDLRESADGSSEMPRISTSKILHIIDLYDGADNLMGAAKESIRADLGPMHLRNEEAIMDAVEDHF